MSQFFYIHPDNPQQRLINQAVEIVRKGGVIVYPTDSGYALGCKIEDKNAMERICRIRQLPDGHNFTLMCRDLSELSTYSFVDNVAFRLMKNNTPGNYTFILKGTKEVPRRLLQEKRKTIGMRVPSNPIAQALLEALGEPIYCIRPTPESLYLQNMQVAQKTGVLNQVTRMLLTGIKISDW